MSVAVTARDVKARRDLTDTGMMDSKRALEASDGDLEKAKDWLHQKGIARAGVKAARLAREGTIEIYLHHITISRFARFKIRDDEEAADGNR
jgi:elongation factor Ts